MTRPLHVKTRFVFICVLVLALTALVGCSSAPKYTVDEDAVKSSLEEPLANQFIEAAKKNEDLAFIGENVNSYAQYGSDMQRKLLRLAAMEPEAVLFVKDMTERYPQQVNDESASSAALTDADKSEGVPRLYQWDQRWGYVEYSGAPFGTSGCSPTSMAMVYAGLTGKYDKSPYDFGQMAKSMGYMTLQNGTETGFLFDAAMKCGLDCQKLGISARSVHDALDEGCVLIANVSPGDFTESGHFLVIADRDDEGKLIINDPYSAENSSHSWDADQVVSQTKRLYAFSK